jgi:hypothetical protein
MTKISQSCFVLIAAGCVTLCGMQQTLAAGSKHERTFEECRDLAVSRGVPVRKTGDVYQREYMQRKAAGLKTTPKGLIVRCMNGDPI